MKVEEGLNPPDLWEEVKRILLQIPKGRVTTYKAIAQALGDEIATRAVARMLASNPEPEKYPCYKVVKSDGTLGGYSLGVELKVKKLEAEGIRISNGKIEEFEKHCFTNFSSSKPLLVLKEEQKRIASQVKLRRVKLPEDLIVAGADVAYAADKAWAVVVVCDQNFEVLEVSVHCSKPRFPYVSTYLTYRELPILLPALRKLRSKPFAYFIDGNGILHPRLAGIATHLGVLLNLRTVGVAKRLLLGKIREGWIYLGDCRVGKEINIGGKQYYVSPGNEIDLVTSVELVKRFSSGRKIVPLAYAHKLANEAKRRWIGDGNESYHNLR